MLSDNSMEKHAINYYGIHNIMLSNKISLVLLPVYKTMQEFKMYKYLVYYNNLANSVKFQTDLFIILTSFWNVPTILTAELMDLRAYGFLGSNCANENTASQNAM